MRARPPVVVTVCVPILAGTLPAHVGFAGVEIPLHTRGCRLTSSQTILTRQSLSILHTLYKAYSRESDSQNHLSATLVLRRAAGNSHVPTDLR